MNWCAFGALFRVFTASLEMRLTALLAVRDCVFPFRRFSAQAPASITSLGPFCLFFLFGEVVRGSASLRPAEHLGRARDATYSRDSTQVHSR